MSLAATVDAARADFDNLAGWVKTFADQHLPAIAAGAADAERIQASPVVQALEAAVLTPGEEAMIARIIAELPALRDAQSPVAAVTEPVQATTPADSPQAAEGWAVTAAQPA